MIDVGLRAPASVLQRSKTVDNWKHFSFIRKVDRT